MRRHLVLPVLLSATLALAACGQAVDTTSGDGDTASPVASPAPESPSTETPTETPTPDPATDPTVAPVEGDCSAAGLSVGAVAGDGLSEATLATAEFLVDAALRCDEQLLTTAATESGTTLTFGGADPTEFFGLPETEERLYATIVTLLTEVPPAERESTDPVAHVWPRVATEAFADDDTAWQEVVDAGLLEADEAEAMRAAGAGYLGWRLAIDATGSWTFLVAGD